jgi:hypothetical protein
MVSSSQANLDRAFCVYAAEVDRLTDALLSVDGEECCPRVLWKAAGIECDHRVPFKRGLPPGTVAFDLSCVLMKLGYSERSPWLRAILVGQCLAAMSIFPNRHLDEVESLSPGVRQLYRVVRYASDSSPDPVAARVMLKWALHYLELQHAGVGR